MKLSIYIAMLIVVVATAYADDTPSPQARFEELKGMLPGMKPTDVSGYQTDRPPESNLAESPKALEQKASTMVVSDPHAKALLESAHQRPYFAIDPTEDPLITNSEEAVTNPEKVIKEAGSWHYEEPEYEEKTCEESKPTFQVECNQTLKVATLTRKNRIYLYTLHDGWNGHNYNYRTYTPHSQDYYKTSRWDGCNYWKDEIINIYRYEVQEVHFDAETGTTKAGEWREVDKAVYEQTPDDKLKDEWTHSCAYLQGQEGACRVIAKRCIAGPEEREFTLYNSSTGKWDGIKIHRDCWQYQYTYECGGYPSKNNCQPLRKSACQQIESKPTKTVGGQVVIWEQTFRCPKGKGKFVKTDVDTNQAGIKLPDDSSAMAYEGNKDMNQAIASLEVLKEIQKDLGLNRAAQDSAQTIFEVFRGNQAKCENDIANFNNCCQKMSGWGNSLGLTKCSADEKQLAVLRDKGLCREIGKICVVKYLGQCVRERYLFCCFPSKLSRIVHEQGRPQLGRDWGDSEHPQCQGFTVEQLSRIDFSKLDLSELYNDIQARMTTKTADVASRNIKDRLNQMTSREKNASQQ